MNLSNIPVPSAAGISRSRAGIAAPFRNVLSFRTERSSILHYAALLYLFLFCSRISEFIPQARISAVLLFILLMAMAITMRGGAIVKMPGGLTLVLLTAWVGVCVPFSVWVGGSAPIFRAAVQSVATIAAVAAFIRTVPEAVRAIYTVGFAMTCAAGLSFLFGVSHKGRLEIAVEGNTFGDPNFYAYYVLTGLPLLLLAGFLSSGFKRIAWFLMILPVLYVIGNSGSRGGMVGFAAGMLFLFWFSSFRQKSVLVMIGVIGIIAAQAVLPPETVNRFLTFFGDKEQNPHEVEEARHSAEARKYLFFRSIDMTIQNPFLGVGPGQFMIAEAADAKTEGAKGAWHVAHNTYTQFSSEMGLPGLGFFLATMYSAFFGLSPIRRNHADERLRRVALMMQMTLVIVAVCAIFLSLGYSGLHYAVIGLSGMFQAAVAAEAKGAPIARPVRRLNHFPVSIPRLS